MYWPATGFFAAWGLWNLLYYPALGQWFSFAAGVLLCFGNCVWVGHVLYYRWLVRKTLREYLEQVKRDDEENTRRMHAELKRIKDMVA